MRTGLERSIELFIQWYHDQLDFARTGFDEKKSVYQSPHRFHCLSIHYTVLESIASLYYPEQRNGERFKNLISNFGNWPVGGFVSIPLLAHFCSKESNESARKVSAFANSLMPLQLIAESESHRRLTYSFLQLRANATFLKQHQFSRKKN